MNSDTQSADSHVPTRNTALPEHARPLQMAYLDESSAWSPPFFDHCSVPQSLPGLTVSLKVIQLYSIIFYIVACILGLKGPESMISHSDPASRLTLLLLIDFIIRRLLSKSQLATLAFLISLCSHMPVCCDIQHDVLSRISSSVVSTSAS